MAGKVVAVIPARLGSKRFDRKVLHTFRDKPLLYYIWSAVSRCRQIDRLIIATDSREIRTTAEAFGAEVQMTSRKHLCGTSRVAEVAEKTKASLYMNIQADNFGLNPNALDRAITEVSSMKSVQFATLVNRIKSDADLFNPDRVKVVIDRNKDALWFSRYPVPYLQGATSGKRVNQHKFWHHIGIYFFRRPGLMQYASWKPAECEKAESLEQLRILENGKKIRVVETKMETVSVDSVADLKKISRLI